MQRFRQFHGKHRKQAARQSAMAPGSAKVAAPEPWPQQPRRESLL